MRWQRITRITVPGAILAASLCSGHRASGFQTSGLSAAELRGQQIYLKGESSPGGRISALITSDGTEMPGSAFACANCHGREGTGRAEGGVAPSNLTWPSLTRPYMVTAASGRKHEAYDDHSLKRAISLGLDPAGNHLLDAMPRFRMSMQDMDDLVAYVKRLGAGLEPGLTDQRIVIGSIAPSDGPMMEVGRAVIGVVEAYFSEVNAGGGVFGRKLELKTAGSRLPVLKASLEGQPVFALVSPITAGADNELGAVLDASEAPVIGPISLVPDARLSLNRHVFYLFSPLPDQVRAMFTFGLRNLAPGFGHIAVVSSEGALTAALPAVVAGECRKSGLNLVIDRSYAEDKFNPAEIAVELRQAHPDSIFLFCSSARQQELVSQFEKLNWAPSLMLLGSLAGKEIFEFAPAYRGRIFISYPTLPSDRTPQAMTRFEALAQKYKFPQGHLTAELSAYCASEVLVEGLTLAGRDLTRGRLIDALETLFEFSTGLTPRITFGPNRHVGALGAYIVTVDREGKRFVPVSGWLSPD